MTWLPPQERVSTHCAPCAAGHDGATNAVKFQNARDHLVVASVFMLACCLPPVFLRRVILPHLLGSNRLSLRCTSADPPVPCSLTFEFALPAAVHHPAADLSSGEQPVALIPRDPPSRIRDAPAATSAMPRPRWHCQHPGQCEDSGTDMRGGEKQVRGTVSELVSE